VHHSDLRSRARERAATNINTDLARETDLLRAVNAALNAHDGATALQRIAQYDGSFRHGLLREERGAAELLALCMLRRIDAARRKLTAFVTRYPQSPLRVRVESACAGQDAGLEPRR
jgi:hypothetical protein